MRHTRLPEPGDERQLKRAVGRIQSQRLDRGKPLWELWLVEGVAGDRLAIVSKTHHCMVDGVSGVDLISVLMSPEPVDRFDPDQPLPLARGRERLRERKALLFERVGGHGVRRPADQRRSARRPVSGDWPAAKGMRAGSSSSGSAPRVAS